MKPSHWIGAVIVLVIMVFGITFFKEYIPGIDKIKTPPPTPDRVEWRFLTRVYPPPQGAEGSAPGEQVSVAVPHEMKVNGWHDYWFENSNDKDVPVGLAKLTCKCSSVELYVMPDEIKRKLTGDSLKAAADAGKELREQIDEVKPIVLVEKGEGHKVPARAIGYVRVKWTGEKEGPIVVGPQVWIGDKQAEPVTLEARLVFLPPIVPEEREQQIGFLTPRDLPRKVSFVCWSATRPNLKVSVRPYNTRFKPEDDTCIVDDPVPLTKEELTKLEEQRADKMPVKLVPGYMLCGYRITMTLTEQSSSKALIDLGPFLRRFEVFDKEENFEPTLLTITGTIQGDVMVVNEDNTRIEFKQFKSSRGAKKIVTLQSAVKGLKLEEDPDRTSKFLKAHIQPPEEGPGGQTYWEVTIEVLPGKVSGDFPREDDNQLRDSAVYLKTTAEGRSRTIRIPVRGLADD
jgi:hypothetical protein